MVIEVDGYKIINGIKVITPRIDKACNWYFNNDVQICPIRSRLATESWKETEGQPLVVRRAKLFARICDEIPVVIFDHELIVGSATEYPRGIGLQLDFSSRVGIEKEAGDRSLRSENTKGILTEENLKMVVEDTYFWKGRSPGDVMLQEIRRIMGPIYEDIMFEVCARSHGILSSYSPDADYEKVLQVGLKGIIEEIDCEISKIDFVSPHEGRKYEFLYAARICLEAEIRLAKRYANLARTMADNEKNIGRKKELETIAAVCEYVPENPARNFWEALQSVRFIHLGLYMEDGDGTGAIIGRMDKYLYPYYKKDIETGAITRQQAAELLAAFWIRIAAVVSVIPSFARQSGNGTVGCRVTIGGVDKDGNDASNELSHLILHVAGQVKIVVPIYLRWHSGIGQELMRKAVQTNIETGSEPAFHNDERAIQGLVADGASLEDARDYVLRGCSHPFPYGSVYGCFSYLNGGKVLELVMNNGYDPRTDKQLGVNTGDPRLFTSIDDWIRAFMQQWEHMYAIVLKGNNIGELVQMQVFSQPFASALMPDCIQKGLGVHEGGARYNQFAGDIMNKIYADVVDSLIAINHLVYTENKITIDELLDACTSNFEGEKGNYILSLVKATPKFGNDSGEPEELYRTLNDHAGNFGRSRTGYFGYPKRDVKNGAAVHYSHGKVVGALPNGRKSGMPLADGGISPCAGCDIKGPTVTIRSVAKAIDPNMNRSAVLNQKIPQSLLKTKEQVERFIDLIKIYFREYNGYQVQWNIQDKETYLAAKKNPSDYRNLIVRIGGYSAYFIELDPILQDQIIARTEQWA